VCLSYSASIVPRLSVYPSWNANCAVNDQTNGVDLKTSNGGAKTRDTRRLMKGDLAPQGAAIVIDLPSKFQPTVPAVNGSAGILKSFILPDKRTGVVSSLWMVETLSLIKPLRALDQ
jgi:hypothetical protein